MIISKIGAEEMLRLSLSDDLRTDMEKVSASKHNPFIKEGVVNVDAYLEFATQFNEFINHKPKPFEPIIEKEMRL